MRISRRTCSVCARDRRLRAGAIRPQLPALQRAPGVRVRRYRKPALLEHEWAAPDRDNPRKLTEIGTDYRYLLDEVPAAPAYRSRESIDHTLTFYEYIHGLLPYDAEMQALMPGPMTSSQRSAVLTFECPQSFTTYLVELRYPTPNRGGFILGLDDFYSENLVPGRNHLDPAHGKRRALPGGIPPRGRSQRSTPRAG